MRFSNPYRFQLILFFLFSNISLWAQVQEAESTEEIIIEEEVEVFDIEVVTYENLPAGSHYDTIVDPNEIIIEYDGEFVRDTSELKDSTYLFSLSKYEVENALFISVDSIKIRQYYPFRDYIYLTIALCPFDSCLPLDTRPFCTIEYDEVAILCNDELVYAGSFTDLMPFQSPVGYLVLPRSILSRQNHSEFRLHFKESNIVIIIDFPHETTFIEVTNHSWGIRASASCKIFKDDLFRYYRLFSEHLKSKKD